MIVSANKDVYIYIERERGRDVCVCECDWMDGWLCTLPLLPPPPLNTTSFFAQSINSWQTYIAVEDVPWCALSVTEHDRERVAAGEGTGTEYRNITLAIPIEVSHKFPAVQGPLARLIRRHRLVDSLVVAVPDLVYLIAFDVERPPPRAVRHRHR